MATTKGKKKAPIKEPGPRPPAKKMRQKRRPPRRSY
jgi:hypothetical protein